jgi:sirohydrochlorin cobaltochelatase
MNCDTCAYRVALPGFADKVGRPQVPHFHPDEAGDPTAGNRRAVDHHAGALHTVETEPDHHHHEHAAHEVLS